MTESRNFNTISPSAEFLVRLKAFTTIPFAKEAAALLVKGAVAEAAEHSQEDRNYFFRQMLHFENRYRTIDKILADISTTNFLELSSGYSFRGLALCLEKNVYFMDTDLPDLVEEKKKIVAELLRSSNKEMKGKLELVALNALNRDNFTQVANKLPGGPVTIINEGLLPYLENEEKTILCSIIQEILKQRGGFWITGDIYIKQDNEETRYMPEIAKRWKMQHHTEENKFEDFVSAEKFFAARDFKVVRRESFAKDELSCLQFFGDAKNEIIETMMVSNPKRQTWCLKISE